MLGTIALALSADGPSPRPVGKGMQWRMMILVIADEDFLDEKPQDALAFRYVEGIRRRPKSSEERGQRFSEAQVGCAID